MDEELSAREAYRVWKEFKEHRAWQWVMHIAQGQIENRREVVLSQMTPGQELEREFFKGEIAGIRTFLAIPDTAMEVALVEMDQEIKDGFD